MRLLLDTHIAIWALLDSPKLSARARNLISAPENAVFVSAASLWEIAIKRTTGRRDVPPFSCADTIRVLQRAGYRILDVTAAHAEAVEHLPPLHSDPFDRMLVAQALTEPLVLVTHDPNVSRYCETIIQV